MVADSQNIEIFAIKNLQGLGWIVKEIECDQWFNPFQGSVLKDFYDIVIKSYLFCIYVYSKYYFVCINIKFLREK